MRLILASTSPYRRALLQRLGLAFECQAPAVDETPLPGEAPETLAARLARAKAAAIATGDPQAWVLGSDQVAALDSGVLLGKPGSHERAREQLLACSGREVQFFTAVTLCQAAGEYQETVLQLTRVLFRPLLEREIDQYLRAETPYDCAGSFKCEGLGIALFEWIRSDDPTGLEGLPLIATGKLLRAAGLDPLAAGPAR